MKRVNLHYKTKSGGYGVLAVVVICAFALLLAGCTAAGWQYRPPMGAGYTGDRADVAVWLDNATSTSATARVLITRKDGNLPAIPVSVTKPAANQALLTAELSY